jgi:oligopeptide transport system substrate-binding protein
VEKIHPNWAVQEGQGYVCNGPFQLQTKRAARYELIKNPLYWHKEKIQLDQVLIFQNNSYTILQMFKNNEIDWLGRPLYPWDSAFDVGCEEKMEFTSVPRIFWYVFNVKRFPFTNTKLRQAFAYAINRKQLLEKFKYEGSPALTPLPLAHTFHLDKGMRDGDKEHALRLFEEALRELGLTRKKFPIITLLHTSGDMRNIVARLLKEQWEQLFGITCNIESYEWNVVFDRMTQGDYQLGAMNWKSFVNYPIYTLNAFRYSSERVNFAKWESEEYQKILDAADQEQDTERHKEHLERAEAALLREMPVIPILYEVQEFKKKSHLKIAVNHQLGLFDFATASIAQPS